jgi:folate-binding protein YgfZ
LRAQLEARLVADEVALADETENYRLVHLWPAEPDADLSELIDQIADPAVSESWMGRRPASFGTWDVLAPHAAMEKIIAELDALGVVACTAEDLHGLRIVAGVPSVPVDAGPGDLPQEAALEGAALSFDKGCYLGQEIMSRLHTQGHVNRGLWQVAWDDPQLVPAGPAPVPLFAGGEPAGELRSRVTKHGESIGLAMLRQRAIGGRKLLSLSPDGPPVIILVRDLTAG